MKHNALCKCNSDLFSRVSKVLVELRMRQTEGTSLHKVQHGMCVPGSPEWLHCYAVSQSPGKCIHMGSHEWNFKCVKWNFPTARCKSWREQNDIGLNVWILLSDLHERRTKPSIEVRIFELLPLDKVQFEPNGAWRGWAELCSVFTTQASSKKEPVCALSVYSVLWTKVW